MHVLLVKMSSLGDLIHTLPALSDAGQTLPHIRFDWVVEEAFAEIPGWHPVVDSVLAVALRRWKRRPVRTLRDGEWARFRAGLRRIKYDRVIDAQGLLKSALVTRMALGPRHGLDRASAREPVASLFYQERHGVPKGQHAITRVRTLFALALGYPLPASPPDYGLERQGFRQTRDPSEYVVFLHGTTWPTKQYPVAYWTELARLAGTEGLRVRLPQGDEAERSRAETIAQAGDHVEIMPPMDLTGLAREIAGAQAAVGVDTGLAHLAAALAVPAVTLYGATRPGLTGTWGQNQGRLSADFACAPCLSRSCRYKGIRQVHPACYGTLQPADVWRALKELAGGRVAAGSRTLC